jgi:catechol 2,3-dioxygenase-like lactoylglutathione lyase family enzyme
MEPRISIITLGVSSLETSLRFYRDGLGFPTTSTPDKGIIFFQTGGVCLALYPYDELARDVGESIPREAAKVRRRHPRSQRPNPFGSRRRSRTGQESRRHNRKIGP